jgi:pimeloyl-ACP methyl ester carboxylesterase
MRRPLKFGTRRARFALIGLAVAGLVAIPSAVAAASTSSHSQSAVKPTIVLEHGAWADGSSWSGVVTRLQKDGYTVDVPPNPLRGPDSDSAYLASYLATVPGPIVLVGHSYGGFVITNAATGDKNVKALVYVDAYIPAQGDTINSLTAQFPGSQITPAAADRGNRADRGVRPAGLDQHPQLGRDRNGRPRDPTGGAGVHGTPRARHGDGDQRLAPVADLPPGRGHERDRRSRGPHVLGR